jgi:hypothetical protein
VPGRQGTEAWRPGDRRPSVFVELAMLIIRVLFSIC